MRGILMRGGEAERERGKGKVGRFPEEAGTAAWTELERLGLAGKS